MTPPLVLRAVHNGERQIIELDDSVKTERTQTTGRVCVYLKLGPGLKIDVGSRCLNKKRITELRISVYAIGYFEGESRTPALPGIRETMDGEHELGL